MTFPFSLIHIAFALIGTGSLLFYRATRRVNPANLVKGTIVSIHTDPNGNHSASIEYNDHQGVRQKVRLGTDFYPSFGQEVQLILKPGAAPDIHEEHKRTAFVFGLIILVSGLFLALIAAARTRI